MWKELRSLKALLDITTDPLDWSMMYNAGRNPEGQNIWPAREDPHLSGESQYTT